MFGRLLRPLAWKRSGTTLVEKGERMDKRRIQVKQMKKRKSGKVKKAKDSSLWLELSYG